MLPLCDEQRSYIAHCHFRTGDFNVHRIVSETTKAIVSHAAGGIRQMPGMLSVLLQAHGGPIKDALKDEMIQSN